MELIPTPDTLGALCTERFPSLSEMIDEYLEPDDVMLDNEHIWPVPPELEF
jgi:hypothetical protein